jgi:predicted deacylase
MAIPVTVFHGWRPGLILGSIAGVHGYEYPPIIADHQFAQTLGSTTMLLVHVANVPGFRSHRVSTL